MKKVLLLMTVLTALLLTACTSAEQKAYEEALQQAKDKITAEEFAEAQDLLTTAVSAGYEESTEAQNLLDQLQQYQQLEGLLNNGKFEEVYTAIEAIAQVENGSTVISENAKEYQATAEQQQQQFTDLQAKVDQSLKLVEEKKYEEANEQLKALDLTNYQASYYESMKTTITKTIAANDKQIAAIKAEEERKAEEARKKAEEARKKAEAEKKAREEAARKNNMLNWTYEEVDQYIANYFGMKNNHVIVEVYDRTSSGYTIEARSNNAAIEGADPNISPALGFFEVRSDGKLYKMDIVSGNYIRVN